MAVLEGQHGTHERQLDTQERQHGAHEGQHGDHKLKATWRCGSLETLMKHSFYSCTAFQSTFIQSLILMIS